ncbi:hypothetical protein ABZ413_04990 [Nocardia rhamnosiphila]|uniref:hypothetical protein n=1 Tax=Nocardia rhamnosiphila TaxID=426716 RepID=UPI0033C61638
MAGAREVAEQIGSRPVHGQVETLREIAGHLHGRGGRGGDLLGADHPVAQLRSRERP